MYLKTPLCLKKLWALFALQVSVVGKLRPSLHQTWASYRRTVCNHAKCLASSLFHQRLRLENLLDKHQLCLRTRSVVVARLQSFPCSLIKPCYCSWIGNSHSLRTDQQCRYRRESSWAHSFLLLCLSLYRSDYRLPLSKVIHFCL